MAINTESGLLQWVVDGILVENNVIDEIKDPMNRPTNLVGNMILGKEIIQNIKLFPFLKS